jgi:hypothetical protein
MPDRPGALGAVASRVGAVGGDVVGIDILERGGGRAIDEVVVDLPDAALVSLLLDEVRCVDGVDVEELRPVSRGRRDPHLLALETVELIVAEGTSTGLLDTLVIGVADQFEATWSAVVELSMRQLLALAGKPPPMEWLVAFVQGSRTSIDAVGEAHSASDIAWAPLPEVDSALVLGRDGRPFHARERRQLDVLTRIADRRLGDVMRTTARLLHPSAS